MQAEDASLAIAPDALAEHRPVCAFFNGIDEQGQLEVHPWQDCYLCGGIFDEHAWLSTFEQVLQSGPAEGYGRTRLLAQMERALEDLPGVENLILGETRTR